MSYDTCKRGQQHDQTISCSIKFVQLSVVVAKGRFLFLCFRDFGTTTILSLFSLKIFFPFSPSKIVCISPSPPLSDTSSSLRARQSIYRSFFFTQRHCAAQGEFHGLITPRSKSFLVFSRTICRSSGQNLRCFSATGVHASFFRGNVSSSPMQAGTRFG